MNFGSCFPVQMLQCRNPDCAKDLPLNSGLGKIVLLHKLSNPFNWRCPECGTELKYLKQQAFPQR
jgi:hypothetical protein